jgi:hypothetical protein
MEINTNNHRLAYYQCLYMGRKAGKKNGARDPRIANKYL